MEFDASLCASMFLCVHGDDICPEVNADCPTCWYYMQCYCCGNRLFCDMSPYLYEGGAFDDSDTGRTGNL